jgi:hypothetical protein
MVKLLLNGLNNRNNNNIQIIPIIPNSKSSKKKIILSTQPTTLNPFSDSNNLDNIPEFENIQNNIPEIDFIELAKPRSSKDLIGLDSSYYFLKKWYFECLANLNNPFLIIIGEVGCGKTSMVNIFCEENNINSLDLNNCNETNIDEHLFKFINHSEISIKFKQTKINKLILIDNYKNNSTDTINNTQINNLYSTRLTNKHIPPVLIISSEQKGSRISDLKSLYTVHYINNINIVLIKNWILSIIREYNKNRSIKNIIISNETIDTILTKTQGDKRFLLNTLNFIKFKNSLDILDTYYKDNEVDNFKFINKLFDSIDSPTIDEVYKIYDTDGYLLANLVHENYIDFNTDIDSIANASDHISMGDYLMNTLYSSEKLFVPYFHALESIIYPGFYSRSVIKSSKIPLRCSVINNRYNIFLNNKKIISKLQLNINDILFYKKFLTNSLVKLKELNTNQEEYLVKLLTHFNNDISILEILYKHFNTLVENTQKNNLFTKKFKEKLVVLINNNGNT